MVKQTMGKDTRKALLNARSMIEEVAKADGNEAETRKRIDHIFANLLGYDTFKHITQEYAIHGIGDIVHCDFAVQIDSGEAAKPALVVEIKRINLDLVPKHVRQAASYAIDIGCEWTLLTNGREWRLYHIAFGKPPQTQLVESWNIINDELPNLADKLALIGYKNIKKGGLVPLWDKCNVLSPQNLLKVILSEESIKFVQRGVKKTSGISVTSDELIKAYRRLLNEAALSEMEILTTCLPAMKKLKRKPLAKRRK